MTFSYPTPSLLLKLPNNDNRAFSLTWPTYTLIHWNKRKFLHKNSRVLSRIYQLGEKSWVAEGDKPPRGVRPPPPPGDFLKWICTEMQYGAFWDTILRNVTVCALTSSRLDDFFDIVTYILYWWQYFLGGRLGILGGKLLPLKYPRQNPEKSSIPTGLSW